MHHTSNSKRTFPSKATVLSKTTTLAEGATLHERTFFAELRVYSKSTVLTEAARGTEGVVVGSLGLERAAPTESTAHSEVPVADVATMSEVQGAVAFKKRHAAPVHVGPEILPAVLNRLVFQILA